MRVFLVDNGSLRPEAWISLCRVARALAERIGTAVEPASVLHSTKIEAALVPEEWPRPTTWERSMKTALGAGERSFVVLPFFFGPTGAITEYLPQRAEKLRARWGAFSLRFGAFLAEKLAHESFSLVDLLAEQVRAAMAPLGDLRPPVVLVDHGSPRREVTAVRDALGRALGRLMGAQVDGVRVASMERREGAEFDFNEPLLERALHDPRLPAKPVILAKLFLSPGRHAGPGGDIDRIVRAAELARPGLRVLPTELVGAHPRLVEVLATRWAEMAAGG